MLRLLLAKTLENYYRGATTPPTGNIIMSVYSGLETWTRPNLTSATSYGTVTDSRNASNEAGWKALDGNYSTNYVGTSGTLSWWKWDLPETIHISKITWVHRNNSETFGSSCVCQFFTDDTKTTALTGTFTDPSSSNEKVTLSVQGIETNCIYFEADTPAGWGGAAEIEIEAYTPSQYGHGRIDITAGTIVDRDKTYMLMKDVSYTPENAPFVGDKAQLMFVYIKTDGSIAISSSKVENGCLLGLVYLDESLSYFVDMSYYIKIIGNPTIDSNNIMSNVNMQNHAKMTIPYTNDEVLILSRQFIPDNLTATWDYPHTLSVNNSNIVFGINQNKDIYIYINGLTVGTANAATLTGANWVWFAVKITPARIEQYYIIDNENKYTLDNIPNLTSSEWIFNTYYDGTTGHELISGYDLMLGINYHNNSYANWSIDLANTFIYTKELPWYLKVGNVVVEDGIASNFTVSDYVISKDEFLIYNDPFEVEVGFTTSSDVTSTQVVMGQDVVNTTTPQLILYGGDLIFWAPQNSSTPGYNLYAKEKPIADTYYKAKYVWDGTTAYFYLAKEDAEYELQAQASQATCICSRRIRLGMDNETGPFKGTIDLNSYRFKLLSEE